MGAVALPREISQEGASPALGPESHMPQAQKGERFSREPGGMVRMGGGVDHSFLRGLGRAEKMWPEELSGDLVVKDLTSSLRKCGLCLGCGA